jgi:hypothetical protein
LAEEEEDVPGNDSKPKQFYVIRTVHVLTSIYFPTKALWLHHEAHLSDNVLTVNLVNWSMLLTTLTFRGQCIVIYSYNKSQQDALFHNFIWKRSLNVSDRLTVHHQVS